VRAAGAAPGIIAAMHCNGGGAEAKARADAGFRLVTVGVDASLFGAAIGGELAVARG
jgi:hypothetical protein